MPQQVRVRTRVLFEGVREDSQARRVQVTTWKPSLIGGLSKRDDDRRSRGGTHTGGGRGSKEVAQERRLGALLGVAGRVTRLQGEPEGLPAGVEGQLPNGLFVQLGGVPA